MNLRKILGMALVLAAALGAPVQAETRTINAAGGGTYLSFTDCFADLAVNGATEPLVIEVAAGTYNESATMVGQIPGASWDFPVTFRPAGGNVLVDGGGAAWALGFSGTSWFRLEGLEIVLDGVNGMANGALYLDACQNVDVSDCRIHHSGFAGLQVNNCQNLRVWNNMIWDTDCASISMTFCGAGAGIEIWNNSMYYDYPDFGGWFGPPAMCLALTRSSAWAHNNIFFKNVDDSDPMSAMGVVTVDLQGENWADYYSADSFDHNCYATQGATPLVMLDWTPYATLAEIQAVTGWEAHSRVGDPLYVDAAAGDLDIADTASPAFGAGQLAWWFTDDIHGTARSHWDAGADFIPGVPVHGLFTVDGGGAGDFTTLQACFDHLALHGIDGPVTVDVAAGLYAESATLGMVSGTGPLSRITIRPAGSVTVDGGMASWALGLVNASWVVVEGLELVLNPDNGWSNGIVWLDGCHDVDLSGCRLHHSGYAGLQVNNCQNLRVWNNQIWDTHSASISMTACGAASGVEIWNNSLYYDYPDFGGWFGPPAICLALNQSAADVHNNIFFKNVDDSDPFGAMGVVNVNLQGGAWGDYYTADSFSHNLYMTQGASPLLVLDWTPYATLAEIQAATGWEAGSALGDPLYLNATGGDLDIASAASPAFGAGLPATWFSDDIHGVSRPQWDLGADAIPAPLGSVADLAITTVGPAVQLSWSVAAGATGYRIYASSDPWAVFPAGWTLVAGTSQTNWSEPWSLGARCYRVTATDE